MKVTNRRDELLLWCEETEAFAMLVCVEKKKSRGDLCSLF